MFREAYQQVAAADNSARLGIIFRLAWHYFFRLLTKPWLLLPGLLIFAILRIIRPIIKVRVGVIHNYGGLGHLAFNNELYLRQQTRAQGNGRERHIFVTGKPANRQLFTMIKRKMPVIESSWLTRIYGETISVTKGSDTWINLRSRFNRYDEFNNIPPQLSFTPEEKAKGHEILRQMGIEPGEPFVCFHARDDAYFNALGTISAETLSLYSQECRDCSTYNYLPAAEHLASQGLYALRMGSVVAENIDLPKHSKVINYAQEFQSDFADVYLLANCKFLLACNSGPYSVSLAFGVPIILANLVPMEQIANGKNNLFAPKKVWNVNEKRFLSFREMIERGIDSWQQNWRYTEAGLEVIENTSEEILALAKEMNGRLDDTWVTTEEDESLQNQFRDLFPEGHYSYGFPSRIGADFLRENRALLEA